jgi:hypothetical protein
VLLVGAGIGWRQPMNVDEERFLGVALEMLQSGNWFIPTAPRKSTATNHRCSCGPWPCSAT